MLQQTTVAATVPYFGKFLVRFPTLDVLAAAPLEDVLVAWAGLGYYARARNLHSCAQAVVAAGGFPQDLAGLRQLPGIGEYTAAAIGAIAFGIPVVPVDGNVERVVARLCAVERNRRNRSRCCGTSPHSSATRRRRGHGPQISHRHCLIWVRRYALPPGRPAHCARGWQTAPAAARALPKNCPVRRQSVRDRCGMACTSG